MTGVAMLLMAAPLFCPNPSGVLILVASCHSPYPRSSLPGSGPECMNWRVADAAATLHKRYFLIKPAISVYRANCMASAGKITNT